MRRATALKLLVLTSFLFARTALSQPMATDTTLAKIDTGAVRGVAVEGTVSFKGIPFAAPPVGELRWRVPQLVKPWQGELAVDKIWPCLHASRQCPEIRRLPHAERLADYRCLCESSARDGVDSWGRDGARQRRHLSSRRHGC